MCRRRRSVLQRGMDRDRLADHQALSGSRPSGTTLAAGPRMRRLCWPKCAATAWPRRRWKTPSGMRKPSRNSNPCGSCWAARRREIPCGVSIGIQDSIEQLLEKIETEAGRRLSAHQGQSQAGLGRECAGENSLPLARHPAELRCQLRLHADRSRTSAQVRSLQSADDRAAAVE